MKSSTALVTETIVAIGVAASDLHAADVGVSGYDWSGLYFGGSVGYAEHIARYEDQDYDWFGATHDYHTEGFSYGVQAGWNWQKDPLVYGIEADFAGFTNDRDQIFSSDDLVNNQLDWMATLRGRAGLGLDLTYLYLTGGVAIADFERSWLEAGDADDSWPDLGKTKLGFAGGLGIEHAVSGNWSARLEGLIARFGDNKTVNDEDYPLIIDDTVFLGRFGVNYRLGQPLSSEEDGFSEGVPFDFSGFYAGVNLGASQATISASDINYVSYSSTYDHVSSGLTGGLQAGYNYQNQAAVYGVEADFALAEGSRSFTNGSGGSTWNTGLNWAGSLKFRTGVAAANTLMYILGGLSIADYDDSFVAGQTYDMDGTYPGYVVGGGIEQALAFGLSGRIEATYGAYSGDTKVVNSGSGPVRGHAQEAMIRVGANYYIGGGATFGDGALPASADWEGFYAGAGLGFAHHMGSRFDRVNVDDGGSYDIPSFGGGAGVHAGLNWQNGHFVYGMVGDFAFYTNEEGDVSDNVRKIESSLNWLSTVRGRAGVATGDSFIYGTAGLAIADVDLTHEFLPAPNPSSFDLSGTRIGWVAGMGVEHMLNGRWSVKMEGLYNSFGEEDDLNGDTCSNGLVTEPCEMHGYDDTVSMKLGISYNFGG